MPSRVLTFLLLLTSVVSLASVEVPVIRGTGEALAARERQLGRLSVHNSNFSALARSSSRTTCQAIRPPEALATPTPLLDMPGLNAPVTVSFIIGTDGRVHSPFILTDLGEAQDRVLLATVLSWRYRPATCNGVPTEAEGKIAFSSQ
jgi:hypothetical protein